MGLQPSGDAKAAKLLSADQNPVSDPDSPLLLADLSDHTVKNAAVMKRTEDEWCVRVLV